MFQKELYHDHLDHKLADLYAALEKHSFDTAIIPSGVPKPVFWDDNHYNFKTNFHFALFVPVSNIPHSYLILKSGQKPQLIFYQPADYWHVVPEDPDPDWADAFEVILVKDQAAWQNYIPDNEEGLVWIGERQPSMPPDLAGHQINPTRLLNELHFQRAVKTDYEIDCLAQANVLAARGHLASRDAFLAGASELEIHLAYLAASKHTEQELPYNNIVALGPHAAILHYTELQKQTPTESLRQSFLIDAGAKAYNYCADITRTWSTNDTFLSMISEFDLLQQDLIREIRPGQSYVALHQLTHQKIADFMVRHELLNCSAEQAVEDGITSRFFPHGLGHLLGLQVHDIGGHQQTAEGDLKAPPEQHPFLRLTRDLQPGYCITIEPGMYFIDLLLEELKASSLASAVNWSLVEELKPFGGIRIEDDVVVTDYGHQNLSRQAFAQLDSGSS